MKKIISILCVCAFTSSVFSQKKVALQSGGIAKFYSGTNPLISAYNAAVSGDTIYLPGGVYEAPTTIDKSLVIYGTGHYVDSTLTTGKTIISNNISLGDNADNSYFEGIDFTGPVTLTNNVSVDHITIKRCKIGGSFYANGALTKPCANLTLCENVFLGNIYIENTVNVLISNSIIKGYISDSHENNISNNIFLYNASSTMRPLSSSSNNQVYNNIFINQNISSGSGNIFTNNLIVSASPYYGTSATVLNSYINVPQANIFVNQTGVDFNYSHNYHLKTPELYVGTDNTEVGIYGGIFPYKEGAVPSNPHIQFKNIAPKTNINGELLIQIQVEAQD